LSRRYRQRSTRRCRSMARYDFVQQNPIHVCQGKLWATIGTDPAPVSARAAEGLPPPGLPRAGALPGDNLRQAKRAIAREAAVAHGLRCGQVVIGRGWRPLALQHPARGSPFPPAPPSAGRRRGLATGGRAATGRECAGPWRVFQLATRHLVHLRVALCP
jgi:hypothetical protein